MLSAGHPTCKQQEQRPPHSRRNKGPPQASIHDTHVAQSCCCSEQSPCILIQNKATRVAYKYSRRATSQPRLRRESIVSRLHGGTLRVLCNTLCEEAQQPQQGKATVRKPLPAGGRAPMGPRG
eukprot:287107-Chlamydomonas_euryale.AAC.1